MTDVIFQSIFDKLQDYLPSEWDSLIYYAAYTVGGYSMRFYIKKGDQVKDCFQLPNVNRSQLIRMFMSIDKDLVAARRSLADKDLWSVMTMIVDANGHMKSYFDYTDISENSIEYMRQWEQKYL